MAALTNRSNSNITSLLEYYMRNSTNGLSRTDFEKIYDYITISNGVQRGLINVNTASRTVLCSLDGMTTDMADLLIDYRKRNTDNLRSIAWVVDALGITETTNLPACHTLLTTRTFQITADIVAVGHNNRGYKRQKVTIDLSSGNPQVIYRQDLTHLGWALGKNVREELLSKETR